MTNGALLRIKSATTAIKRDIIAAVCETKPISSEEARYKV